MLFRGRDFVVIILPVIKETKSNIAENIKKRKKNRKENNIFFRDRY